jgi:RimK family alpha-L-glutamate ligase
VSLPGMSGRRPCVLIATDSPGWHGRKLTAALDAFGMDAVFADLAACRVDLSANRHGVVIPGFADRLPDAVLVREIAAGTFEQVTLRLGILHVLEAWEVPVCNGARAVERTVDKSMTSMLLARAGVATPATWVTESAEEAAAVMMRELAAGQRLVAKPLFGSQGKGLRLIAGPEDLPSSEEMAGVYYLQRFVVTNEASPCDYRAFVVGDKVIAAMRRVGPGWIHNVAQGARCEAVQPSPEFSEAALRAVKAVGAHYAGVDLMRGPDGQWLVIEVNGIPAWRGLLSVAAADIARCLVQRVVVPAIATSGASAAS